MVSFLNVPKCLRTPLDVTDAVNLSLDRLTPVFSDDLLLYLDDNNLLILCGINKHVSALYFLFP